MGGLVLGFLFCRFLGASSGPFCDLGLREPVPFSAFRGRSHRPTLRIGSSPSLSTTNFCSTPRPVIFVNRSYPRFQWTKIVYPSAHVPRHYRQFGMDSVPLHWGCSRSIIQVHPTAPRASSPCPVVFPKPTPGGLADAIDRGPLWVVPRPTARLCAGRCVFGVLHRIRSLFRSVLSRMSTVHES